MGHRVVIRCALLLSLFSGTVLAGPVGLPDSARPGAVRPEDKPEGPPKPPPGTVMEIPPVIDRPLEIDEGPRIAVAEFRLLDARDLPKHDIAVDELRELIAAKAAEYPDGLTVGNLQEVADVGTQYYREKGLILAQVVVPVQNVEAGVVEIQIYEGKLGRVLTEGNIMYKEVVIKGPFRSLIGEPVTKDAIESALLQVSDFPGLTVFGVFQPGQQVGTADIVLRVQEEDRFDIAYRVDNHGVQETGRNRFRPTFEWNNITGGADRLAITVQQTYNPKNNVYKAFDYDRYLGRGFKSGFYLNRNKFDVGGEFEAQDIFGETEQMALWLDKSWFRSRQFNLSTRLELARKESKTLVRGNPRNRDRLTVLSLSTSFDHVDTRFKGLNFATLELSRGFNDVFGAMGSNFSAQFKDPGVRPGRQGGSGRFAGGQFEKILISAQRLQTLRPNTTLLVRSEFQWSNDLLVPMEQYSVGGPDNLRALPPAQILLDRALFMSVEIIQNMPFITDVRSFGGRTWGELVQLSAFYDQAIGALNDPLDSEPDGYITMRGAGVQGRFTLPGKWEARIMAAWELGARDAGNERRPQLWGDVTYRF